MTNFHSYLRKIKTVYQSLPRERQDYLFSTLSNDKILDGLRNIDNIESLTMIAFNDHELNTASTTVETKSTLLKKLFEGQAVTGDEIETAGMSLTSITICSMILMKTASHDNEIVETYPELFV